MIKNLNTNAFNANDILYVSQTVAGALQTTQPLAPNNIIQVAAVVNKSTTVGTIFVRPTLGSQITKDEGIKITTPVQDEVLKYQSATGIWENKPEIKQITARGTRTQTGNFQPTLVNNGTTPFNLFQSNFSWLSSYYAVGTKIVIEISGRITLPDSELLVFSLNIGGTNYTASNLGITASSSWVVRYTITISSTSEIKFNGVRMSQNSIMTGEDFITVNLNNNLDIYVQGEFSADSATNAITSNLVSVDVIK